MPRLGLSVLVVSALVLLSVVPSAMADPALSVASSCRTDAEGRTLIGVSLSGSGFVPNTSVKNDYFDRLDQFSAGRMTVEADGTIAPIVPVESIAPTLPFTVLYIHEEFGPDLEISPGESLLGLVFVPEDVCNIEPVVADKQACKKGDHALYGFETQAQCLRFLRLIPRVGPFPLSVEQCEGGSWAQFGFNNETQCLQFVEARPEQP